MDEIVIGNVRMPGVADDKETEANEYSDGTEEFCQGDPAECDVSSSCEDHGKTGNETDEGVAQYPYPVCIGARDETEPERDVGQRRAMPDAVIEDRGAGIVIEIKHEHVVADEGTKSSRNGPDPGTEERSEE